MVMTPPDDPLGGGGNWYLFGIGGNSTTFFTALWFIYDNVKYTFWEAISNSNGFGAPLIHPDVYFWDFDTQTPKIIETNQVSPYLGYFIYCYAQIQITTNKPSGLKSVDSLSKADLC